MADLACSRPLVVARAGGRTCVAQLAWPGLKLIDFLSVYLETGGEINENNLQLLSDIAEYLLTKGTLFGMGGFSG